MSSLQTYMRVFPKLTTFCLDSSLASHPKPLRPSTVHCASNDDASC